MKLRRIHFLSVLLVSVAALAILPPPISVSSSLNSSAAEKLSALIPHSFWTLAVDAVIRKQDGATNSCALHALYTQVLLKNSKPFNIDEFAQFRSWATKEKLFSPKTGTIGANFDALAKRFPEFFGIGAVQPTAYTFLAKDEWVENAAQAMEAGHSVLAFTGPGDVDHVFTILNAVRNESGTVVAFDISDPNSYRFWETTNRVSVESLKSRLATPVGLGSEYVALNVSTRPVYIPTNSK